VPTYLLDCSVHNTPGRYQGVGRYTYYLARALHGLRAELAADERLIATVRLRGDDAVTADLVLDRHEEPMPPPERRDAVYNQYFKLRWVHMRRTLASARADVIHFVEGPQALPTGAARSIVTCHDLIPLLMPHEYLPRRDRELVRRAKDYLRYRTADRIVAISRATADALVTQMSISSHRIKTVLQGVDHDRFHPRVAPGEREQITTRYRIPPRYTVFVGMADPRKRVDLLLRCYPAVFRATGVPLVLVGRWSAKPPRELARLLDQMPADAVRLVDSVDAEDLAAIYRHADLHVLPSIYEGFGLTVLEAMAAGCPVITTRGGALGEVAGDAASYVVADSATDLEMALVRVVEDADLRADLRARGLARAAQFTWERTARETLAVYRHAAGR
jgi:glycosyltransferase involved in cell wall biosynthesis